jgi:hypothetical protein
MSKDSAARLLEMVVGRLGKATLAQRLNVPVAIVEDWILGHTSIPEHRLLDVLDVLDDTLKR